MGILFVRETFERQYTSNITGDQSGVKTYFVLSNTAYTVLDNLVADAITAGLPDLEDAYSVTSPSLVVVKHIPKEIEKETKFYSITVQYASNQRNFGLATQRPWDIEFYSIAQEWVPELTLFDTTPIFPEFGAQRVHGVDVNQPIVTTSSFPFTDPPVTDFKSMVGIRLKKNFTNVSDIGTIADIAELMTFTNSVNDNTAFPAQPLVIAGISGEKYQFWMESIGCVNTESGGEDYYATQFDVIYDPEYHIAKILNAGWHDAGGTIKNEQGGDISQPWPIDENGIKVFGNAAARAAGAIYRGFGVKPPQDWNDLGLPVVF